MFARAEKEFFDELKNSPDSALSHTMISMCKSNMGKRKEAMEFARKGLELDPDLAYGHYALAVCYARFGQPWLAMPAIIEALNLDPDAAEYWGFKSYLHLCMTSRFVPAQAREALECAENGLRCDPHDAQCMQLKARALLALNRKSEAFAALNEALALDPNDSETHEMRAWLALEGGKSQEARDFYVEALRLDPTSASARTGLLSALRAKHAIYRFILKFMSTDGAVKFLPLVLIGGAPYAVASLYRINNPICQALGLALILPVCGFTLFSLFAFFLANPIFNLVLWIDPDTRWSLSADEILASKILAVNLIIVTIMASLSAFGSVLWYFPLALFGLLLAPTVITFTFPPGKFRMILYAYLCIDFLCAVVGSGMLFGLDILDAHFKGVMDQVIGVWATILSVSVGMSIMAFAFEAFFDKTNDLVTRFQSLLKR